MKPSKSEPIAACSCEPVSSRRRSAWRRDHVEGLLERLRLLDDAVVELVLGEDQPDHAAAGGDAAHRVVVEVVLLLAEAVARVRGDDGVLGGAAPLSRSSAVEQLEGLLQRVAAHVRDVDQHALAVHRAHGRLAELGQAGARLLGEEGVVERVGQERERRRVGRDAAPEQVGERHVGDAARRPAR